MKKISDRVTSNKSKHLQFENKLIKLQKFDVAYFRGKSHLQEDDTQNYLVFSEYTNILGGLWVLIVVIIYTFGNL